MYAHSNVNVSSKRSFIRYSGSFLILVAMVGLASASGETGSKQLPGAALVFDGVKDHVILGDLREAFDQHASISLWVKQTEAVPAAPAQGFVHVSTDDSHISHYPWSNGQAYINTFRRRRAANIELSPDIDVTRWHLVTITSEPGDGGWKLYQNTELVHQDTGMDNARIGEVSVLGACSVERGPDYFFGGSMADVRLYDRVLSPQEIARLHQGRHVEDGLVAHWPMNAGVGDKLVDIVGDNHGRFVGSPQRVLVDPFIDDIQPAELRLGETLTLGPVEFQEPQGEVTYQWHFNGQAIEGAESSSLVIEDMTDRDAGIYHVMVNDARELTPSSSRRIRVAPPDWPMWRFDAERSAQTPHKLAEQLRLQWVRQLPRPQRAWHHQWDDLDKLDFDISYAPVVMGRNIFVPSNVSDSVTAYDIESGEKQWRFYANGPVRLAPAAGNGRVYFVSDDGYLYCLDAESGSLHWKFRGGLADHHLLGNERIISLWAARGAPVLDRNVVYFAAGLWPLHGVFVYALDAETGRVIWVNDTTSSEYVEQPHGGAYGYGGLVPQGYLALTDDQLVVAGGRTPPAFLNRHTGELEVADFRADGAGGYAVHGIGAGGMGARRNPMLIQRVGDLEDQIDGEVFYKLAARDRLFVVTECGKLYCFGHEEVSPVRHEHSPGELKPRTSDWTRIAQQQLADLGESEGYAIMLGAGSGDLLRELLVQSSLHVTVVEPCLETAAALRDELVMADLYGRRAAVIQMSVSEFKVQPYLFSMIVSEDAAAAGVEINVAGFARILNWLRPYGGTAWLGCEADYAVAMLEAATAAQVDQVSVENRGNHLFGQRGGPLSGAAQWTHEYADAANTLTSTDERVRLPLGVLWFGGPDNHDLLPRHTMGPRPQVAGGRQVHLGPEIIGARCVYTGRRIWQRNFGGIGHPFTNVQEEELWAQGQTVGMRRIAGVTTVGSPYVTLADSIYLRYGGAIHCLDAATGETTDVFEIPGRTSSEMYGQDAPDWGHVRVVDDVLITTAEVHVPQGRSLENLGQTGVLCGTSSGMLVVMNRHDGEVLWTRRASIGFRHSSIVASHDTLYVIDGVSEEMVRHLARRGTEPAEASKIIALDLRSGELRWQTDSDVFGTYLIHSERHGILLEGGNRGRGALRGEPREVAARDASDGSILWHVEDFRMPGAVRGDALYPNRPGQAIALPAGEPLMRVCEHTGEQTQWKYFKRYGCDTFNASEHLLLFRSGAAGYYDLEYDSGTGTLGGFRSGCTQNLIAADGVLNALDQTRTCICSYAHQTSLALVHMPQGDNIEVWTRYEAAAADPAGHGINFGAPGRRVDRTSGTIWHDQAGTYRRHPSALCEQGSGITWVAASSREAAGRIVIDNLLPGEYTIQMHFAELQENVKEGDRVFDVLINGESVISDFDVTAAAGSVLRGHVESVSATAGGDGRIEVKLRKAGASLFDPIINGMELQAVDR